MPDGRSELRLATPAIVGTCLALAVGTGVADHQSTYPGGLSVGVTHLRYPVRKA